MSTNSRSFFNYLPPLAECLALIIGAVELIPFGFAGLNNPTAFADGYGLPISNTIKNTSMPRSGRSADVVTTSSSSFPSQSPFEQEQQEKRALVAAIAARNIQNGVLLLTFGLVLRDRKSLGVTVLAGLVATVADTAIVGAYGVKNKVVGHYVGIFNSLVIGGSLLYWGRNDRWC